MGKNRSKLLKMNENNNYSERNDLRLQYMSECEKCCCNSCTGFKCPWTKQAPVGTYYYTNQPHKFSRNSIRCGICRKKFDYERIFDCDYYTYYKRKRYYKIRKVKKSDKLDEIIKKLDILLKK